MLLQRKEDQQPVLADCQRLFATALDMLYFMQKTVQSESQNNSCNILLMNLN